MKKQRALAEKYYCAFCGTSDVAIIQKIFSNTSSYRATTNGGLLYLTEDNHLICDSCICDAAIPIKLSGHFALGFSPFRGKRVKIKQLADIVNLSPLTHNPLKNSEINSELSAMLSTTFTKDSPNTRDQF